MKKGDHLKIDHGMYTHHGIYLGNDTVIHFGRGLFDMANAKVETVSLATFSGGSKVEVVNVQAAFSPEEIVDRAKRRLDESDYNLFENNCEHFVNWCRTGRSHSPQIANTETAARQTTAAIAKPIVGSLIVKRLTKAAVGRSAIKLATRTTGVALVGDATQAITEVVAARNGMEKNEARRLGMKTGATTSAALGMAVGGPVGGIASVGIWYVGQLIADHTVENAKKVIINSTK